jgi:hypothetical protein
VKFVSGITDNFDKILDAGTKAVTKLIAGITDSAQRIINAGINSLTQFLNGLADEKKLTALAAAGVRAAGEFIDAVVTASLGLVDKGADAVVKFINGVSQAIDTHDEEMGRAGARLAESLVTGFSGAIRAGVSQVVSDAKNMATSALGGLVDKIKPGSPSKVTYQYGLWFAQGFANGIADGADEAVASTTDMANNVIKAINTIPDLIDTEPVITPILDLTAVRDGATRLTSMINAVPTVGMVSTRQASIISSQQATQTEQTVTAPGGTSVKFEQNNYSPEALSEIEIYRQTRNQLSQLKSVLALT